MRNCVMENHLHITVWGEEKKTTRAKMTQGRCYHPAGKWAGQGGGHEACYAAHYRLVGGWLGGRGAEREGTRVVGAGWWALPGGSSNGAGGASAFSRGGAPPPHRTRLLPFSERIQP